MSARHLGRIVLVASTVMSASVLSIIGVSASMRSAPNDPGGVASVRIVAAPGERAGAWFRVDVRDADGPLRAVVRSPSPPPEPIGPDDVAFRAHEWVTVTIADGGAADTASVPVHVAAEVPERTPAGAYAVVVGIGPRPAAAAVPGARTRVVVRIDVPGEVEPAVASVPPAVDMALSVDWRSPLHPAVSSDVVIGDDPATAGVLGGLLTLRTWSGDQARRQEIPSMPGDGRRHVTASWGEVPLFGPVTVTVEVVDQRGPDRLVPAVIQSTVWIVPWHLVAVALGAIAVAVVVERASRARRLRPEGGTP